MAFELSLLGVGQRLLSEAASSAGGLLLEKSLRHPSSQSVVVSEAPLRP